MTKDTATVKTIRADDATMEKFRAISANYENQGQALATLVQLHESQQMRASTPTRAADIDTYESHLIRLREMFFASISLADDANTRARATYDAEITTRDRRIADLQSRLDAESAGAEKLRQQLAIASAKAETAAAKDQMIQLLTAQLDDLRATTKPVTDAPPTGE